MVAQRNSLYSFGKFIPVGQQMKKLLFVSLVLMTIQGNAYETFEMHMQKLGTDSEDLKWHAHGYLVGLGDAFLFMNGISREKTGEALFCPPEGLKLSSVITPLTKVWITENGHDPEKVPLALGALRALQNRYPCD